MKVGRGGGIRDVSRSGIRRGPHVRVAAGGFDAHHDQITGSNEQFRRVADEPRDRNSRVGLFSALAAFEHGDEPFE